MKILLTGSNGQLGADFRRVAGHEHEVVAHDLDLDITDRRAVKARVSEVEPDIVVNAAAYTNVDAAESDELNAYNVNALGPWNLALACQAAGVPLLHVSTDFVFSGESDTPYTEFDLPDPSGVYGKSKYAGELYVTGLLDRYYICRTSWLYGVGGGNFVKTMLTAGRERNEVKVVDDQEGAPTYSLDLARKLLEIIATGAYGVYHLSNQGSITWRQFACDIFEIAGIDTPVLPITTRELDRPAPRPRYSTMRGLALEMAGMAPMRPYREALEQFILEDIPSFHAEVSAP
ncbi:MAG: dTDP-4-dehydrorhamnose reductase [Candidatus Anoxymicrobium japonicum]|uniref:dTDP-4-dehydrorhamnose reductase n=1 Tax=Candidatus Anoxymicrobium japonicum TaxID=2013648 RepID=A0A2N3G8A5_9ACTN|nr:MAG: dTDP-4-dehydrorhamnose reductase [Candidatus Anoxymicrobium japonicum]